MMAAILEYRANLAEPVTAYPQTHFTQSSYSHWAVDEILMYIFVHLKLTPIQAVERFRAKMNSYSTMQKDGSRNTEANCIFSIAYDVATDILDILIAME